MGVYRRLCQGLVLATLGASASNALAWGAEGHRMIGYVADAELTPKTKAAVQQIMKGHSLAEVANWMDDMRGSMPEMAPWHYVTIQVCDPPVPPFPCKDGCVTEKITWAFGVLKAPPNPDSLTALRVLVHLVGDIHQPLHTGENHDHGGNGVQLSNRPCVEYGATKPTACKLHTWWDTELVRQALGENEETTAATVWAAKLGALPPADADDPNGWAVQSNGYARSQAYTFSGFACTVKGKRFVTVDDAYDAKSMDVVMRQVATGGKRLARILNRAFDP